MHVPSLYLDTSVIGGYFDKAFEKATQELWRQMERGRYRFVASALVAQEILDAPPQVQKLFTQTFIGTGSILPLNEEMEELAETYMHHGVVPARYADDAVHVAACVVGRIDYLVSWNFKHLVNVNSMDAFNAVNLLQGYPSVRIVNPLELIYGNKKQEN